MGLKPTFKQSDIKAYLQRKSDLIEERLVNQLALLGMKCIIEARTNRSYTDQTSNLINSTGFIIVRNGKILTEDFKKSGNPKKTDPQGRDGLKIGRTLAMDLVGKYRKGFALIVVAGMNYAVKVESKGYNVLSSAEKMAEKELPGMMKQLETNISKIR